MVTCFILQQQPCPHRREKRTIVEKYLKMEAALYSLLLLCKLTKKVVHFSLNVRKEKNCIFRVDYKDFTIWLTKA